MKKFIYILSIGLFVCFLLSTAYLYVKAVPNFHSHKGLPTLKTTTDFPIVPTDINTLNNYFPFNLEDVCMKPTNNALNLQINNYQFKEFITNKRENIQGKFMRVEGNNIYKKGNATLLIPQSFNVPTQPIFYREKPTIILPDD